jgi:uncharacterized protein (TIGR02145 family)
MKSTIISFLVIAWAYMFTVHAQSKGILKDPRDGQVYKTIKIGEQWWMAQNLNYQSENSFCYDKDTDKCKIYGRLYIYDNAQNACPTGWHLPSDLEWEALSDYLGGEDLAGVKMKDADTKDSLAHLATKANSSGFTALAGGNRNNKNIFGFTGKYGCWWSSTDYSATEGWSRYLYWGTARFYSHFDKKNCAFSVRCLKNQ